MQRFYAECVDPSGEPVLIILKEACESDALVRLYDKYKISELIRISTTPVVKPRRSYYRISTDVIAKPGNAGRIHTTASASIF